MHYELLLTVKRFKVELTKILFFKMSLRRDYKL